MAIQNFAIPAWILENMSPEEQAALKELAAEKQFQAADHQISALAEAAVKVQDAQVSRDLQSAVTFLKAAATAAREALFVLDPTEVQAQTVSVGARLQAATRPASGTPATPVSKQKSNATWYYVRNNLDRFGAGRYADPADLRTKNPEGYRSLQHEAAELFDAGKLSPSGKLLA